MTILKGAEPFLLPGTSSQGILLVHGFTGSPSEMRLLGEYLQTQGYTVLAPRLPGHGSRVEEMNQTDWHQWYGALEDGYHMLLGLCSEIAVIGLSMGGLLALKLAVDYPVNKVVSLSSPIYLSDRRLPMLPVYRLFHRYMNKERRKYLDIDPAYSICYDSTPLRSLSSLLDLIKHVDQLLPSLHTPILVMQSQKDHTVRPRSARHIFDRIGSIEKRLIWLEKSGHMLTLDSEREQVFRAIDEFLRW